MPKAPVILPSSSTPMNLDLPEGAKFAEVESDLYNIANRIREIEGGHRLKIIVHQREDYPFVVMEYDDSGEWSIVAKFQELDARVIERLQYLRSVPLETRLAEFDREEEQARAKYKEEQATALYETMGRPMWTQLEKDGFIEGRGTSYAKVGVAAPGRAR